MKTIIILNHFILVLLLLPRFASAASPGTEENLTQITPFTDIGQNVVTSYSGWNSVYHIGAMMITAVSVSTGIDAEILRLSSRMDPAITSIIGHTGLMIGYAAPIIAPATMYLISGGDSDLRSASYAVMQTVAVSFAAGNLLKAITGRTGPDPDYPDKNVLSRDFNFGFMHGGLHYGWPSGHLLVNTAMVTALAAYYPEKTWIRHMAWGYITFLSFSILIHDRGGAHWFSDIVAGGLMGFTFGNTIGRNFRQYRLSGGPGAPVDLKEGYALLVSPQIGPDYTGIVIHVGF